MVYLTQYQTPVGMVTLASDGIHLTGLWIKDQKYEGQTICGKTMIKDDLAIFSTARQWLKRYFNGLRPSPFELPLCPMGSRFRLDIWEILCQIPYGEVITYGDIAEKIAGRMGIAHMSAQAVGGAVGHNPISIIIPCHRVVGANGNLTGYAGGIQTKRMLLKSEGVDLSCFRIPKKSIAQ